MGKVSGISKKGRVTSTFTDSSDFAGRIEGSIED